MNKKQKISHVKPWRQRFPEAYKAQNKVRSLNRCGFSPGSCCWPGCSASKGIHAHHPNYDKPYLVILLCAKHHKHIHMKNTKIPALPITDLSLYVLPKRSRKEKVRRRLSVNQRFDGQKLKMIMKQAGLKPFDLSHQLLNDYGLKVSEISIFYWRSGKYQPRIQYILALCDLFEKPIEFFVSKV